MSTFDEQRNSHSKSPIDDSFREIKLLNYSRPLTTKKFEKDILSSQKKIFTRANPTPKPKRVNTKERLSPILTKLKQSKVPVEKEKLYQENIALKVKINSLKSLVVKSKTKINHLEKELQKKEDPNSQNPSNSLVKLLKQSIKELKSELENKAQELLKQKKSIKFSRLLEQEIETKAYMDECTRLKRLIEEILAEDQRQSDNNQAISEPVDQKTANLLKKIEENSKEIRRLKERIKNDGPRQPNKSPKLQEESSKTSKEIEALKISLLEKDKNHSAELDCHKKTIKELENEISSYRNKLEESNTLVQNLYKELKSLRQKKKSKLVPPKILQVIHKVVGQEGRPIESFLSGICDSKSDHVLTSDLLNSLKMYEADFAQSDIDQVITYIKQETNQKVSIQKLTDYYESFDFSLFACQKKKQKIADIFEHLNLRMQLHRIHKPHLIEALMGSRFSSSKQLTDQETSNLFTNAPFDLTRKQSARIVEYLFDGERTAESSKFLERLYGSIKDWQVFTTSDEEEFDQVLTSFLSEFRAKLEKYCLDLDREKKGTISNEQFFMFVDQTQFKLSDRIRDYLVVLFYSQNMELKTVPYMQFVQAYTTSDDRPVEPKTGLIQNCLERISAQLLSADKSVREVFNFDKTGLVFAEDFINGLKSIGIEDIPKDDLEALLKALQYESEPKIVCIFIEELEDILETYGVIIEHSQLDSNIFSDQELFNESTEGHVQKISLLDSAQLDLASSLEGH